MSRRAVATFTLWMLPALKLGKKHTLSESLFCWFDGVHVSGEQGHPHPPGSPHPTHTCLLGVRPRPVLTGSEPTPSARSSGFIWKLASVGCWWVLALLSQ